MKKTVVNKNFNKNYLHRWMDHLLRPKNNIMSENKFPTVEGLIDGDTRYNNIPYEFRYVNKDVILSEADFLTQYTDMSGNDFNILNDIDNFQTFTTDTVLQLCMCSAGFLDILDTLNVAQYNGAFNDLVLVNKFNDISATCTPSMYSHIPGYPTYETPDTVTSTTIKFSVLMNTILSTDKFKRDSALTWLVTNNILTQEAVDRVIAIGTTNFSSEIFTWEYDDTNDTHQLYCNEPFELIEKYREVDNTTNEKMFFMFNNYDTGKMTDFTTGHDATFGFSHQSSRSIMTTTSNRYNANGHYNQYFTYTDIKNLVFNANSMNSIKWYRSVSEFYSTVKKDYISQFTYFALELGLKDIGGDLQFDHLDKVDWVDNFKFRIKLPMEIR